MDMFFKLIKGEYGLGKTYWLFGFLGLGLVISILSSVLTSLPAGSNFVAMLVTLAMAGSIAVVYLAIWNAAIKHTAETGKRFWSIIARIFAVIGGLGSVFLVGLSVLMLMS